MPARRPLVLQTKAASRMRAWRARVRNSQSVYKVTLDADALALLVRLGWLADADAFDPEKVGRAVEDMLAEGVHEG